MGENTVESTARKVVLIFTIIWSIFLIPSLLMIILLKEKVVGFGADNYITQLILSYNILAFPFVLLASVGLSWIFLHYKHYKKAIIFSLFPLATFLIEIVAADIALLLA